MLSSLCYCCFRLEAACVKWTLWTSRVMGRPWWWSPTRWLQNTQKFSFKCSNGEIFKCFYSNVQMFSFKYSNVQMVNTQNVVIEKNQNHLRVCWHYTFQQTIGLYQTNNYNEIPKFTNSSVWVNILLKNKTKTFPN